MRTSALPRVLRAGGLLLALLLAPALPVAAKGGFSAVVIVDLETGQTFQVSDPALEAFFALSDFTEGTGESPTVGKGYELTRGVTRDSVFLAVDRLRYYPPGSQAHGYIFYEGLINGWSEYDGKWFASTRAGEATMARILSSAASNTPNAFPIAAGAIAGVVGLALGFLLGRRFPALRPA